MSDFRVTLKPGKDKPVRFGHPWVFSGAIGRVEGQPPNGTVVDVVNAQGEFLARGLYNRRSQLAVRLFTWDEGEAFDRDFLRRRLARAALWRNRAVAADTTAYRLVFSEADGLPGLVVDRYGDALVVQISTLGIEQRKVDVVEALVDLFEPTTIVERADSEMRDREGLTAADGVLYGTPSDMVGIVEHGLRFKVDLQGGQKTGFYLDQRDNRARVQELAKGREVLNVFSFSGGFSLYAACGGARSVTDLDISKHALDSANRNFALNPWSVAVPHECVQGDAFEWIANGPRRSFDLIICDPPSLARREADREGAIRAYGTLAANCLRRLSPGGVLVAASCSAHVSQGEFFDAVMNAADHAGPWQELWRSAHAPDHPATFAEAHYLKCIALKTGR